MYRSGEILKTFVLVLGACCLAHGQRIKVTQDARVFGGELVKSKPVWTWPWLSAFIYRQNDKFFCAGTLISRQNVLSAAHCFHPKQRDKLESTSIYVLLGQHDIENLENSELKLGVDKIFVHPDWDQFEMSFDADIAVVKLLNLVKFTDNIKSLAFQTETRFIRGGHVVGWGQSEMSTYKNGSNHETQARELPIRAVTNEDCFLEFPEIAKISSRRTFCAGWPGFKANVCHGDSGGGFYAKNNEEWILQGVVSSSYVNSDLTCNVKEYAVFTRVASFASWIKLVISRFDTARRQFIHVAMNCKADTSIDICFVENFEITGNSIKVISSNSFTTASPNLKTTKVVIEKLNVFEVPHGLKEVYPNLDGLTVERSDLVSVSRKTVAGLKSLAFPDNNIVDISLDTFWECPDLMILNLNKNKIENLDENLFLYSPNLLRFEANSNRIESLHRHLFRNTQKLQEIFLSGNKLSIIDVDFIKVKSVVKIDLLQNICVNSIVNTAVDKQFSQFKFHEEIARKCSRRNFCTRSLDISVMKQI